MIFLTQTVGTLETGVASMKSALVRASDENTSVARSLRGLSAAIVLATLLAAAAGVAAVLLRTGPGPLAASLVLASPVVAFVSGVLVARGWWRRDDAGEQPPAGVPAEEKPADGAGTKVDE